MRPLIYFVSWVDWSGKTTFIERNEAEWRSVESTGLNVLREWSFDLNKYVSLEKDVTAKCINDLIFFDRCTIDLIAYKLSHKFLCDQDDYINIDNESYINNIRQEIDWIYVDYLHDFINHNKWGIFILKIISIDQMISRLNERQENDLSTFDKRLLNEKGLFERYSLTYNILFEYIEKINSTCFSEKYMILTKDDQRLWKHY